MVLMGAGRWVQEAKRTTLQALERGHNPDSVFTSASTPSFSPKKMGGSLWGHGLRLSSAPQRLGVLV